MPKNKVSDPITDQEMAFARLILSGAMTDRQAAEAAGLNPDSAAYTKSKPSVRAYMLEHRAAVEEKLVQQEAEGLRKLSLEREQVLDRLWEIARLSPEMTRGSVTSQVKALSMIVAMQNFIPNRHAVSSVKKSAVTAQQEDSPGVPEPGLAPGLVGEATPDPGPSPSTFANLFSPSQASPQVPYIPLFTSVPDLGVDLSIKKTLFNPFVRPR